MKKPKRPRTPAEVAAFIERQLAEYDAASLPNARVVLPATVGRMLVAALHFAEDRSGGDYYGRCLTCGWTVKKCDTREAGTNWSPDGCAAFRYRRARGAK